LNPAIATLKVNTAVYAEPDLNLEGAEHTYVEANPSAPEYVEANSTNGTTVYEAATNHGGAQNEEFC
jgi:hypothetical protein